MSRPRLLLAVAVSAVALILAGCAGGARGGITIAAEVDTDERYGIGVATGDDNLRRGINAALAEIVGDGTYADIFERWFPEGDIRRQLEGIAARAEGGERGDPASYELAVPGRMVVGSDLAFAPFEFVEDGESKGFDIELVTEIAGRLSVDVEFVNTSFDTIFTQLANGQFDAIVSGITITPERDESIDFSTPYFVATQGIAVLGGSVVASVADLDGKTVAVQAATTGESYARERFAGTQVLSFPTSEAAFGALRANQVDAVFIDLPVAQLAAEGEAVGGGVLTQFLNVELIVDTLPALIAEGLVNTLYLSVGAIAIGLVAGLGLSLVATSDLWWVRLPARVYIDIFRGLPAILTIALVGLGLPSVPGLDIFGRDRRLYAILALGLISTAYIAETFRTGIQSLDKGQMEAARSMGMSYAMAMRLVIVPQAVRRVLPALTNEFIAITKDSSLAFVLGIGLGERDLFRVGQNVSQQVANFSPLVGAGLAYLLITVPLTRLVNYLDARLRRGGSRSPGDKLPAPILAGQEQ
ncbi:MAG: ABC transporter substrate-binding protein/permease [Egibacteraceae bacterium]